MKSNLIIQKNEENSLIERISNSLKDAKKVFVVSGSFKESGYNLLEEELLDTKIKSKFIIGVDKKNTTKFMLESLLKLSKDVFYYVNNSDIEFNSNYIIIENTSKAKVYFVDGISENTLKTGITSYFEIEYDLKQKEDKDDYKEVIKKVTSLCEMEEIKTLTKESIEELLENKEIFSTRQYTHTVMSISELLNKNSQVSDSQKQVEEIKEEKKEIPKIDLSDIDFDIDIPEEEQVIGVKEEKNKEDKLDIKIDEDVKALNLDSYEFLEEAKIDKQNELYDEELENMNFDEDDTLDINGLLFEKADVKLNKKDEKKSVKKEEEEELVGVKKVNLNNVSNLIMQLPQRPQKGQDLSNIKVPNYIKQMIPEFFGFNEDTKNESINGSTYKVRNIEVEIVNALNGEKYKDSSARIMAKLGQTYLTFNTDEMKNIDYKENDIVRIIKLSNKVYHIEIISQDLNEYKVWDKLCNQAMKSSDRRFGVM